MMILAVVPVDRELTSNDLAAHFQQMLTRRFRIAGRSDRLVRRSKHRVVWQHLIQLPKIIETDFALRQGAELFAFVHIPEQPVTNAPGRNLTELLLHRFQSLTRKTSLFTFK